MADDAVNHEHPQQRTVGMLAGSGLLPICFARGARRHGIRVVAIAIKGEASSELAQHVDEIHWTGLMRLGEWIRIFKKAGVEHAVMCGGVDKANMYRGPASLLPDWRSAKLWYEKLRSRQDHTILDAVAGEFESEGIKVESSVLYCPELLAERGRLTEREPTEREWADIRFGWPMAKQIAAMQIGQTVVIKDGAVIAVEGMDGTNATLERGGKIARGGAVAVKVAKGGHDPRFDIPCVGPDTVEVLERAGISALAVEAGNTIILERELVTDLARKAKAVIVALSAEDIDAGREVAR
jgi:DUF1009 family protein